MLQNSLQHESDCASRFQLSAFVRSNRYAPPVSPTVCIVQRASVAVAALGAQEGRILRRERAAKGEDGFIISRMEQYDDVEDLILGSSEHF
jgi:hypothetical protein